jgi:hypothetical protein
MFKESYVLKVAFLHSKQILTLLCIIKEAVM